MLSNEIQGDYLRLIGCLLLLSGFFVVVAAMVLMNTFPSRLGFVVNGHKAMQKEQR